MMQVVIVESYPRVAILEEIVEIDRSRVMTAIASDRQSPRPCAYPDQRLRQPRNDE